MRVLLAVMVLALVVGGQNAVAELRGDGDGDGELTSLDALLILQEVAGLDGYADGGDLWSFMQENMPDVLTINRTGCAPDNGWCLPVGWNGTVNRHTGEIIVSPDASPGTIVHEMCHLHQFRQTDAEGERIWGATLEATAYLDAAELDGGPGAVSAAGALESFAIRCSDWYLRPALLRSYAPATYAWFEEWLP